MTENTSRPFPTRPVLIVDDEEAIVRGYASVLYRAGITNTVCHTDTREALKTMESQPLDMLVLDLNMPHHTGEELLEHAASLQPGIPVLIATGKDAVESAVSCMKKGAFDYLVKPIAADRIVASIRNALQVKQTQQENRQLNEQFFADELRHPEWFSEIKTRDPAMLNIFLYLEAVAAADSPVLITGETGVGKELVARAIHRGSGRTGAFVAVNAAGLDDTMFSDTLFGHVRGAFSGAESARPGLIAKAAGGTLFLDEIGDLSGLSQTRLLRLLQEHEYMPLGQDFPVRTDARFVVATNADLSRLQAEGKFRKDLYYRLSTHKIHVPPLRERKKDIPLLVDHFLEKAAARLHKTKPTPPPGIFTLLSCYSFPGNLRELDAMIGDAVSRHTSRTLSMRSLREYIRSQPDASVAPGVGNDQTSPLFCGDLPPFNQVKRLLVTEAMRRTKGNRTQAAHLLKTTRQALSWYLSHPEP